MDSKQQNISSDENENEKPEVQVAKITAKHTILVAVIGALASIITVALTQISGLLAMSIKPDIQMEVNNKFLKEFKGSKVDTINGKIFIHKVENLPVGTIVSSVLRYETFLSINGLDYSKDMKIVKWVPCDGRYVNGAVYGTKKSNVPDLRGLFLRNTNNYEVVYEGVNKVKKAQRNPDSTDVGKIQYDAIKGHRHSLSESINNYGRHGGSEQNQPNAGVMHRGKGTDAKTDVNEDWEEETRPKNMTVYFYIKIN